MLIVKQGRCEYQFLLSLLQRDRESNPSLPKQTIRQHLLYLSVFLHAKPLVESTGTQAAQRAFFLTVFEVKQLVCTIMPKVNQRNVMKLR